MSDLWMLGRGGWALSYRTLKAHYWRRDRHRAISACGRSALVRSLAFPQAEHCRSCERLVGQHAS